MKIRNILLLLCLTLMSGTSLASCNNGDEDITVSNLTTKNIIGKWVFSKSYQKNDGQWKEITFGIPDEGWHEYCEDGFVKFHSHMNGKDEDVKMHWMLDSDTGEMLWFVSTTEEASRVKVSVDGDIMTVLYSRNFDPTIGQVVEGEFKDVLIRDK